MRKINGLNIILDTHILLFLMNGDERLKRTALLARIKERANFGHLYVSPISFCELGMLQREGMVEFSISSADWVVRALDAPGVRVAPLTIDIAVQAESFWDGKLSMADQIILATAQEMKLSLATLDKPTKRAAQKHRIAFL